MAMKPRNRGLTITMDYLPIGSMYGIFTYTYNKNQPNVDESGQIPALNVHKSRDVSSNYFL